MVEFASGSGKLLFKSVYQDINQIENDLILLFESLDPSKNLDIDAFKKFLLKKDAYKKVSRLLKYKDTMKDFLNTLIKISNNFDYSIQKRVYIFNALVYQHIFKDIENAHDFLEKALMVDKEFSLAMRLKAWLYFEIGDMKNWIAECKKAVSFSKNIENLLQCAYLLSLGNIDSFKYAEDIYKHALSINQDKTEKDRGYKNYLDAKNIFEYIDIESDDELPVAVLTEMRPGAIYWKMKSGVNSAEYSNALRSELSSSLQGTIINERMSKISEDEIPNNKLIKALYMANHARNMYLQWYHGHSEDIEVNLIEEQYKNALTLFPAEIIIRSWYSTFFKEVKDDYITAMNEINTAIEYSKKSKNSFLKDHPMLYNNKALILIDGFQKQRYKLDSLFEAKELLKFAIKRVEDNNSDFLWPYESMAELEKIIRNSTLG